MDSWPNFSNDVYLCLKGLDKQWEISGSSSKSRFVVDAKLYLISQKGDSKTAPERKVREEALIEVVQLRIGKKFSVTCVVNILELVRPCD